MRTVLIAVALAIAVFVPAAARAHQGHAHNVMGTVSSVEGGHVMVATAEGKTVMVMMDSKTTITSGKTKVDASAVKAGIRVVAEGPEDKGMIMATRVRIGASK